MIKIISFVATISILLTINYGSAHLFHANIIDLSLPNGFIGIIITASNNRMTDLFNSQIYMEIEGKRGEKFGRIPVIASFTYTLLAAVSIFFYYKSYFI